MKVVCYQCSKDGPEVLFGKSRITDCRDEPCFYAKIKLLSCQIQMNMLFKNIDEKKGNTIEIYTKL